MSSKASANPFDIFTVRGTSSSPMGRDLDATDPRSNASVLLHEHFKGCHVHFASGWSTAFYAAFLAMGLEPGDEVIIPALAPIGIAHAIQLTGARPNFVDVSHDCLLLSLDAVEAAITEKTRIVVVSHLYGQIAQTDQLHQLLKDRGICIIEDGSDAFTALGTLEAPGEHSDILISCLPGLRESEGDLPGFIVTRTEHTHQLLSLWTRQHDISERVFNDPASGWPDAPFIDLIEDLSEPEDKRLCDAMHAIADIQSVIDKQVELYDELLADLPVRRLRNRRDASRNLVSYPIHVQAENRDELFAQLSSEGFEIYRSYRNLSELKFFAGQVSQPVCAVASKWSYGVFSLPTGPHIGRREQIFLVQSVKNHFNQID